MPFDIGICLAVAWVVSERAGHCWARTPLPITGEGFVRGLGQQSSSGQSNHSLRAGVHLPLQLPLGRCQDALQWALGIVTPESTVFFQGGGRGSKGRGRSAR